MAKETIRNASVFRPSRKNGTGLVSVRRLEGKAISKAGPTCPQDSDVGLGQKAMDVVCGGIEDGAPDRTRSRSQPRSPAVILSSDGRPLMGPMAANRRARPKERATGPDELLCR